MSTTVENLDELEIPADLAPYFTEPTGDAIADTLAVKKRHGLWRGASSDARVEHLEANYANATYVSRLHALDTALIFKARAEEGARMAPVVTCALCGQETSQMEALQVGGQMVDASCAKDLRARSEFRRLSEPKYAAAMDALIDGKAGS